MTFNKIISNEIQVTIVPVIDNTFRVIHSIRSFIYELIIDGRNFVSVDLNKYNTYSKVSMERPVIFWDFNFTGEKCFISTY